jgi:hypothetical protein
MEWMLMADHAALLARLQNWSLASGDLPSDRQLADEVLMAYGWRCEPDASFEGGARWFIGPYSAAKPSRPHPINDLDIAVGLVPRCCNWRLTVIGQKATAHIWADKIFRDEFEGRSNRASVALLIAVFKYAQRAMDGIHGNSFPGTACH